VDRFLNRGFLCREEKKGGARWALPFFLGLVCLVAALRADTDGVPVSAGFSGSLDAGARLLYTNPAILDALAASAGFPKTGGLWLLWGGGATVTPGPLRAQISAWEGSLAAAAGQNSTVWRLGLAALTLEQAYPVSDFIFTAGVGVEVGSLEGSLIGRGGLTGVESALFGYNLQAGVRWPAQTRLAFLLRGGWEYLAGPGNWHGTLGSGLGSTFFELGGPTGTLQLELSL